MLFNIANFEVDLVVLSQSFPDIEHLTFQNSARTFLSNYDNILRTILDSDSEGVGHNKTRWSKLQTIAVSAPGGHLSAPKLQNLILKSQHVGRSIRKLMLPRGAIPMEDAETSAKLENSLR
ncbi:hypothetical protein FIBSPDRAFT_852077 [Athelia psychrophila]|uniref:Uncharacterized protein n=1 Tax=Athelia psychrophila TaxID=1759441 RepID=A0A166RZF3_9AGAM|nr:hypothetical protein FIBSPDRAFT_852077 [Fibularhizoctonia sp. CBS 109695]